MSYGPHFLFVFSFFGSFGGNMWEKRIKKLNTKWRKRNICKGGTATRAKKVKCHDENRQIFVRG